MTVAEIEKRILDACKTIRALPDPEARFFQFRSLWPDAPQSSEEAYGYDLARMPRFRPTPAQVSDCLPALALMRGLPRREWRLIWWRSLGWGFRHIAAKIGRSEAEAKGRYRDVILKVWCGNSKLHSATASGDMLSAARMGQTIRDRPHILYPITSPGT